MSNGNGKTRYDTVVWLGKLISVIVFFVGTVSGAVWGVMNGLLDDSQAETAACRVELSEARSACDTRVSEANGECDDRVERESTRLAQQLEACHDKVLRLGASDEVDP